MYAYRLRKLLSLSPSPFFSENWLIYYTFCITFLFDSVLCATTAKKIDFYEIYKNYGTQNPISEWKKTANEFAMKEESKKKNKNNNKKKKWNNKHNWNKDERMRKVVQNQIQTGLSLVPIAMMMICSKWNETET